MYVDKYVIAKKWSAHQPVPWMARVRHPQAVFRSLANAKEICLAARTNGARITNLNINLVQVPYVLFWWRGRLARI
jgi:hypothetical protein